MIHDAARCNAVMKMARKSILLYWAAILLLAGPFFSAAWAAVPTLVVLDFDLLEDHPDASRAAEQQHRLERVRTLFADGVAARGLYQVVDLAPARDLLAKLRRQQAFMHRCASCQVGNLILNINIQIREVDTERVVLTKSVDIRGNTDRSWERGMNFLVRDLAERHQADPAYGR
jgi:hypothetical protein